jgi:hypothetical protein
MARREAGELFVFRIRIAEFEDYIFVFEITQLAQTRSHVLKPQDFNGRRLGSEDSDAPNFALLLRKRTDRHCKCTRT